MTRTGIAWGLAALLTIGATTRPATAQSFPPDAVHTLASDGTLHVAINYGNPVLAQRTPSDSAPHGVSADLARELASRLGVPVSFTFFNEAGAVFQALQSHPWDVAFLAIDPVRAADIAFTPPYVDIEGAYAVPQRSMFHNIAQLDTAGARIAVAAGSAYDLYLTRTLQHAQLIRMPDSAGAADVFRALHLDALAGVKQPLQTYVATHRDARLLPGHFMVIEQAIGIPKSHAAALPALAAFVEEMKSTGFVARSLAASHQPAATVAPAANRTTP